jgi:hypothetical protein
VPSLKNFTANNTVFWDVTPRGALVRADVSVELIVVIIRVEKIRELGTLAVATAVHREESILPKHTRRNIPENGILHSHRRENPKSYRALTGWAL